MPALAMQHCQSHLGGPRVTAGESVGFESTEENMRRLLVTVAATTIILTTASLVASRAEAIPLRAPASTVEIAPIENVALCFYVDGWNGPGLYQCGYRFRRGEGWYGRREERRELREERRDERWRERREEGREYRRDC